MKPELRVKTTCEINFKVLTKVFPYMGVLRPFDFLTNGNEVLGVVSGSGR
jgi:hypothetical protein